MGLCMAATVKRHTDTGAEIQVDTLIEFDFQRSSNGYQPSYSPPYPGEPPTYSVDFADARLDPEEGPDEAPGPITTEEKAEMKAWFYRHDGDALAMAADDDRMN